MRCRPATPVDGSRWETDWVSRSARRRRESEGLMEVLQAGLRKWSPPQEAGREGAHVDAALAPTTGDVDPHVARFGDQRPWRIHRPLQDQLLQPQQRTEGRPGVDGG